MDNQIKTPEISEELKQYAMSILEAHDCNIYTYGGRYSEGIMDDLMMAYPNGMDYPYIDVANAILSISHPAPIVRAPWRVQWVVDHCCDTYDAESFGAAKESALTTLLKWAMEEISKWKDGVPTEEQIANWNYVYFSCSVCVQKYNPKTDEYEDYWSPSEEDLVGIGWVEYKDLEKLEKKSREIQ